MDRWVGGIHLTRDNLWRIDRGSLSVIRISRQVKEPLIDDEKVRLPPLDVLRVGLWYALVFGLAEVGIVRMRLLGSKKFTFMSPDFPWMTPVAAAILLLAGGVVVLILAWLLRGRHRLARRALDLRLSAVISILYRFLSRSPGLDAAGRGHRLAARPRDCATDAIRSRHGAPQPPLGRGAGGRHWHWPPCLTGLARTARDRCTARSRSGAPNVLLIILDTVRSLDLSMYGYDRPTTPFLERFARAVSSSITR